MEPTDYLQRISPFDQLLYDREGNLVGIRNRKGHGNDFRPGVTLVTDPVTGAVSLVSPDGIVLLDGEVSLSRYMRNSTDFSYGMRAAVEEMVAFSASRKARSYVVNIPQIAADWDGESINVPAFAKFRFNGGVDLNCSGADKPVIWVRSDLPGYVPTNQNIEGAQQLGRIFDTGGGALILYDGLRTAGGAGIRVGSGDGVMGDLYSGSHTVDIPYTIFMEIGGIAVKGFDHGIELTNMHNFCTRFQDMRVDGGNKALVTSSAAGTDFGELTTFDRVFFSNNFELNAEVNAAHQLSFTQSSFTFCRAGNIDFNADLGSVLFSSGRFEGGEYISKSSGAYPRAILAMLNTWIVPSKRPDGVTTQPHHMRKFFQGQHQVRGSAVFHMGGVTTFDTTYAAKELFYGCDTTTDIKLDSITVLQRTAAALKEVPIMTRASMLANAAFTGNITGWARGGGSSTGTVTYLSSDGANANGCLSLAVSAQQGIVFSDRVPVVAGRKYGADALFKLLATPTPTASFYVNQRVSWFGPASTVTLASNPFTTVSAGSGAVSVTHSNHGLSTGDTVTLSGAATVDGITGAQLTGTFTVTNVNANTYQITTAGSASVGAVAGGGAAVSCTRTYTYLSSSSYVPQGWLSSASPSVYDTWMRHGGTGIVDAPAGAIAARLEIATNTAHTGTLLIDEAMFVEM